ncbi:MAG: PEGA domain-containing protein, partial [Myxococcota bacterium]
VTWSLSPSGRTIQLRVTSEPSAASVFVDDELVGQTPLTRPLDVNSDNIELRFEKDGFAPHEVFIGTREDELRYEASLRASP